MVPQPDSLIYIKDQMSDTISKGATSPVNPDEKQISQKTKLFLMSAEDQFMYKFFFYLPVGVSFLIYSILTYFYVFVSTNLNLLLSFHLSVQLSKSYLSIFI